MVKRSNRGVIDTKSALAYMADADFLRTRRYVNQQMRADRTRCSPQILEFEKAFVRAMQNRDIPFFANEIFRSSERQNDLFKKGHSKAKAGSSPHPRGQAVDLIHSTHAWDIPKPCWDMVGHIGKEIASAHNLKLDWGGDWNFYDPAHWQLTNWRNIEPTRFG